MAGEELAGQIGQLIWRELAGYDMGGARDQNGHFGTGHISEDSVITACRSSRRSDKVDVRRAEAVVHVGGDARLAMGRAPITLRDTRHDGFRVPAAWRDGW